MVTAQTIAHVRQVIERTGYVPICSPVDWVPSVLVWLLRSCRRSPTPSSSRPVQALTDRLWEAGYQVLLGLSGYPGTREDALLAAVLSRASLTSSACFKRAAE
jgi:LacI family transcriptional regulator, gluconate utilization system Gnt-I transcriptional repressor